MFLEITGEFDEPEPGKFSLVASAGQTRIGEIISALEWLNAHAGQELGHTLTKWSWREIKEDPKLPISDNYFGTMVGGEVISEIITQSRYAEDGIEVGEYYGDRQEILDEFIAACKTLGC